MTFSLKAGIALAALAGAAAVAGSASAADLGGNGGSMKDGYVEPLPQVSRGPAGPCYFRADVGYSVSRDPDAKWAVNNNTFAGDTGDGYGGAPNGIIDADEILSVFAGDSVSNTSLENTWFGDVGVGCGSGSRGLRGEVMLGYHGNRKFDGEPQIYNPGPSPGDPVPGYIPPPPLDDPLHTDITSYTMMFNAYKDLGRYGNLTPYVGAGVGVAYNIVDEVYFTGNPALTNRIEGDRDLSFAWSLMAGVGYQISDRAILDVGYRYIDLGEASSGRADNAFFVNPPVELDDISAHEIKVGLRYHFGQSDCCAAEYAPMK
jgi:opacity protein-like surface antigen